jgi:hypothetical protein
MENLYALFAILTGLLARFAVPILITVLAVYFLKGLDERWQMESEVQLLPVKKPECWKVNGCPPEARNSCRGYLSPLACWQVFRLPNGYLRQECLACTVFRDAPLPARA